MAIVINEFQIDTEAPPSDEPTRPAPPANELSPHEVLAMLKHSLERAARIRAH
jgi:hypothetical protein